MAGKAAASPEQLLVKEDVPVGAFTALPTPPLGQTVQSLADYASAIRGGRTPLVHGMGVVRSSVKAHSAAAVAAVAVPEAPPPTPGPDGAAASPRSAAGAGELPAGAVVVPPDSTSPSVVIVPLGNFTTAKVAPNLDLLAAYTSIFLGGVPVSVLPPVPLQRVAKNSRTGIVGQVQLLASDVNTYISSSVRRPAGLCYVGVTMVDIYNQPDWNFVFAQNFRAAATTVLSFARHDPSQSYALDHAPSEEGKAAAPIAPLTPDERRLLNQRCLKVMAHEVCHLFGIAPCRAYECRLNCPGTVRQLDAQPAHACPQCLQKIRDVTGCDLVVRYKCLRRFYLRPDVGMQQQAEWVLCRLHAAGAPGAAPSTPSRPAGSSTGPGPATGTGGVGAGAGVGVGASGVGAGRGPAHPTTSPLRTPAAAGGGAGGVPGLALSAEGAPAGGSPLMAGGGAGRVVARMNARMVQAQHKAHDAASERVAADLRHVDHGSGADPPGVPVGGPRGHDHGHGHSQHGGEAAINAAWAAAVHRGDMRAAATRARQAGFGSTAGARSDASGVGAGGGVGAGAHQATHPHGSHYGAPLGHAAAAAHGGGLAHAASLPALHGSGHAHDPRHGAGVPVHGHAPQAVAAGRKLHHYGSAKDVRQQARALTGAALRTSPVDTSLLHHRVGAAGAAWVGPGGPGPHAHAHAYGAGSGPGHGSGRQLGRLSGSLGPSGDGGQLPRHLAGGGGVAGLGRGGVAVAMAGGAHGHRYGHTMPHAGHNPHPHRQQRLGTALSDSGGTRLPRIGGGAGAHGGGHGSESLRGQPLRAGTAMTH